MAKKMIITKSFMSVVQILLYIKSATWIILSVIYFFTLYERYADQTFLIAIISVMMFVNGIIMIVLAFLLKKKIQLIYYGTIVYMFVNIILAFADQFGLTDLLALLIDVAIVVLLIRGKKEFVKS
ncbi:hypothetical protein A2X44_04495 [candidate division CPR3 bacterium GWF2_35_18]|uniref:DUF2127 domain-containing protein n=1 Tax=candidate division CPR3 bacterium GW2011_GWF2_35_18 TaxID=1618350 RepID=A0A0G0BIX3_UNCC3|nr:MAG: hypothetical protein UR67_C0007G0088 [candidate division CPR3 bacterium GW2011_GWF2_35_18]OGB62611.1 MAG: hypothetical protein A2X44_04495 [candidate division CPR3 bacterium GWF2_35_18]OGB65862.1 MAG: hypothetical protein A2250_01745 [candidate division CPR3 bacterium RIFOXYA2_FULL_35_13]OGB78837.1 MAG: hypothetical protein A2296_05255 [candidate division CPR3 bacterium RIFOXYB2_FULL_35_8]